MLQWVWRLLTNEAAFKAALAGSSTARRKWARFALGVATSATGMSTLGKAAAAYGVAGQLFMAALASAPLLIAAGQMSHEAAPTLPPPPPPGGAS